jgi:hypothetical protein
MLCIHLKEKRSGNLSVYVSCKIHRIEHTKCCAEDKAPVAILQVGKFKFKQKMDG